MSEIKNLLATIARLRDPDSGCPWDLKQTHKSLIPFLLEEAYEAAAAIESGEVDEVKNELGDVLLQVVLHAQIASEAGAFNFSDIAAAIDEKMIRRHPHVFSDKTFANEAEQKEFWEAEKRREKKASQPQPGILDDLPVNTPALMQASQLQKRVARQGFDWPEVDGVIAKVREEVLELEQALGAGDLDHVREEFGDLLFAVVNLGRFLSLDAEAVLLSANTKFASRFQRMTEYLSLERQQSLEASSLDEMEAAWQAVKTQELQR